MIEDDFSGRILLKDYDGEDIIDTTITFNYEFNLIAFVQGMGEEEIEARISVDDVLNEILITRLLIFAAIDIVIAVVISVILRRKAL
jgi:subtilase family serine protease